MKVYPKLGKLLYKRIKMTWLDWILKEKLLINQSQKIKQNTHKNPESTRILI